MHTGSRPVQLTTIDAARLLLERMGVSPADLPAEPAQRASVPLFGEYIPRVADAVGHGTRRVYSSYWNQVLNRWGSRSLAEVTALDISQLAEQAKANAIRRRNSRGGRSAAEHMLAALRCVYRHAVADGIIAESENPALRVAEVGQHPSRAARRPAERAVPGHCADGKRPRSRRLDSPASHRDSLPTRRRPRPDAAGSRCRSVPDPAP